MPDSALISGEDYDSAIREPSSLSMISQHSARQPAAI